MTPMPDSPKVVVLIDPATSAVVASASNISSGLEIDYTTEPTSFNEAALGLAFNSTKPQ